MDTVEKYIYRLPDNEMLIAARFRDWLLRYNKQITERIRYGVPFFDYFGWMCYLNPMKQGGIDLCFIDGSLMIRNAHLLTDRSRKTVRSRILLTPYDVDVATLRPLLDEAMELRRHKQRPT